MTKKENDLFRKIYSSVCSPKSYFDGIFRINGYYYAANRFMAIRAFDKPDLPMVSETDRSEEIEAEVERSFDEAIQYSIGVVKLPEKSEIVELRKIFSSYERQNKAYLLEAEMENDPNMKIGVNINYLNMFLDVFGGRACYCYTGGPVSALYFVNDRKNIDAILMPIKVRNMFHTLNREILYKKEGA